MLAHARKDKLLAQDILEESFQDNSSVLNAVKNDKYVKRRIHILIRFMVNTGVRSNGLFMSECSNGAAIAFPFHKRKIGLGGLWDMMMLALFGTGLRQVIALQNKEKHILSMRPKDKKYYYLWLVAVKPEKRGQGILSRMYKEMTDQAKTLNMDFYYESSVEDNIAMYQHKGAEVFHTFPLKDGTTLFCLRHKLTLEV